jgi:hypothetical protein
LEKSGGVPRYFEWDFRRRLRSRGQFMDGKVRKEGGKPVVFTANRLRDGQVLWLTAEERWSDKVAGARVYEGTAIEEGRAAAAEWERRQEVVGSYPVEVALTEAGPAPLSVRERVRAQGGPSTKYGLAERAIARAQANISPTRH